MTERTLPAEFAELEDLVGEWALADELLRNTKRLNSSMDDLRSFYQRMMGRIREALNYLEKHTLSSLAPQEENLYRLCLMLAEVGNAIDYYGVQHPIGGGGGRGYDQLRMGRYEMHFDRDSCRRVTIAHGTDQVRLW